jgi:subtilase family serine protease
MRPAKAWLVIPVLLSLLSTLALAAQTDRIPDAIDSSQLVAIQGNVHGLARPEFDLGRAAGSKVLGGVSLVFRPSPAQQAALDKLLADQQNPSSSRYHKWLTPAQFADRFGMSRNDIQRVTSWLQSQGFNVTHVANSRNQVFFDGTVAQIELTFHTEIHEYLVEGEVHFANATDPAVPSALGASALAIQNLHNFQPKPRLHPHFTSHVSGNHYIAPGDFATIYDLQGLYSAGVDGSGQKIAVTGQSNINLTDVANYRSAAGLAANAPTLTPVPGTGTTATCPGDEGESDLDVEFSGGIAKGASITLYVAGLGSGTTCSNRTAGAFAALQYVVDNNVAPVISNSYGNCESAIGSSFALTMRGWAQQANSQGQTIISATGDSGAADCDFHVTSATQGLAVDMPASIPEVTGAGGTEFNQSLDPAGTVSGTPPNTNAAATTYWTGTTGSTDALSSALKYIPEVAWNDTAVDIANHGFISASGGGESIFFGKPSWQTGTGVPNDSKRDVPDIAVSASADHDGYLFCSEDGATVPTCSSGFRDSTGHLAVVGGTSAAAPTLSGIFTLLNQYVVKNGFQLTPGLGNVNPNLYHIATFNATAFNDVTLGNNIVPCTQGTTGCPAAAPFQYGFSAGKGYDLVTGLGSVNANQLATAWGDLFTPTTVSISPTTPQTVLGQSESFTATVTPSTASGIVSFFVNGSATALGTASISGGTGALNTTQLPGGSDSITAAFTGIFANSNASPVQVTVSIPTFTLTPNVSTLNLQPGQTSSNTVTLAVASSNGFVVTSSGNSSTVLPVTYTCTVSPAASEGPTCVFSPSSGQAISVINPTVAIVTIAPTAKLHLPLLRGSRIFYAVLFPGVIGIALAAGSRTRSLRLLALIAVLSLSTLGLSACGGSSNNTQKNPGTPPGSYKVTVNATTTTSTPAVTSSTSFTVTVQ